MSKGRINGSESLHFESSNFKIDVNECNSGPGNENHKRSSSDEKGIIFNDPLDLPLKSVIVENIINNQRKPSIFLQPTRNENIQSVTNRAQSKSSKLRSDINTSIKNDSLCLIKPFSGPGKRESRTQLAKIDTGLDNIATGVHKCKSDFLEDSNTKPGSLDSPIIENRLTHGQYKMYSKSGLDKYNNSRNLLEAVTILNCQDKETYKKNFTQLKYGQKSINVSKRNIPIGGKLNYTLNSWVNNFEGDFNLEENCQEESSMIKNHIGLTVQQLNLKKITGK